MTEEQTEKWNVHGVSDGTNANGMFALTSEWIDNDPTGASPIATLVVPQGMKAKIWMQSLDAEGETLAMLQESIDGGSSFRPEGRPLKLSSAGHVAEENQEPIIVTGREPFDPTAGTGTVINFAWQQPSAVVAHLSVDIEWVSI